MDGKKTGMKLTHLFAKTKTYDVQLCEKFQVACRHLYHIQVKNIFIQSKNPAPKTGNDKSDTLPKKRNGFEGFSKLQNYFYKMTELRERREKFEQNLPQMFANAVTCCIQFCKVF